ncbi:MAG: phosphorothioation-dependent restriction protein DptH, partial [Thermomicrobiales bacterium]|nr:phosphorothioation-dependent restriction protein DptH [Thermomicrobiales bacterium]
GADQATPTAVSRDTVEDSQPTEHAKEGTTADSPANPPAPVESRPEVAQEIAVILGDSGGGEIVWRPSVQGSPHLFVTGIPGQGKSWTILRLLIELHRQAVPALVFDFHGQLGSPEDRYVQVAAPVVVDAVAGLPFSPFECSSDASTSGWNATAFAVSEIFAYVCDLGDIQRDAMFTAIRDSYRAYGFGADDRNGLGAGEYPTLEDVHARIEQAEKQKRTQNLVARCRPLLEMDVFRPPVGTRNDLIDTIKQGMVVDLHRLASETLQLAAGAFLLRKVYRDMFQWGPAAQLRLAIVLDEAHRLARDVTLPKIMKEGRKYGVAVVVASQGHGDFHPDVIANAGTKIVFRTNFPESRRVSGFFRMRSGYDVPAIVEGLGVGNAVVQTPEMPLAVRSQMRPPD